MGASYYAATRIKSDKAITKAEQESNHTTSNRAQSINLKFAFQKQSVFDQEYFTAIVSGAHDNCYYRLVRRDGGFDTGLKLLQNRIEEQLPLLKGLCNQFDFKVYDKKQNIIPVNTNIIEINQGKFGILGQPIPEDICLEIDDITDNSTGLQLIFKKNEVLPLRKNIVKEVSRTIIKNSDDSIIINVLEGPQSASPISNKPIGIIKIDSHELDRDLIKGTDVEITIEMTESRDLKISTILTQTDQEFEDSFSATQRYVNIDVLKRELIEIKRRISKLKEAASSKEDFMLAAKLLKK